MAKSGGENGWTAVKKKAFLPIAVLVVAVVAVVLVSSLFAGQNSPSGLATAPVISPEGTESGSAAGSPAETIVTPTGYAVRQRYFEEVFRPRRNEYKLFEKAAEFLGKPIGEIPAYFSLKSEEEIFADLPAPAGDFSEIAYLVANGSYFTIGYLEEEYFKQPEFYPNFKESGLRYWTKPDPSYWTPNGYGSYPAEQWTTLKKGSSEEFSAVVFFYSGWGVQTFQGVTLMPDSESQRYFDIEITPQDFLLEPTFPKFYKNWAYKIHVVGKLRPDTPPGEYLIGINVEHPPKELRSKWEMQYKNIYFDAASSGIMPSGNQIQFNVTVE